MLRYLKGTRTMGLVFHPSPTVNITGFSDADYGGDLDYRRSVSGYCFLYNGMQSLGLLKSSEVLLCPPLNLSILLYHLLFRNASGSEISFLNYLLILILFIPFHVTTLPRLLLRETRCLSNMPSILTSVFILFDASWSSVTFL